MRTKEDKLREALEAVELHGTVSEAARHLGVARKTLSDRYHAAKDRNFKTKKQKKSDADEVKRLRKIVESQAERIEHLKKGRFKTPQQRPGKTRGFWLRAIVPDSHGMFEDEAATAAMLTDLSSLGSRVREVVMLGDHIDCGGFLAQHHTLGYVAEAGYTFDEDQAKANLFLDRLQAVAPKAKIDYLEGNHECLSPDHDVLTKDRGWVPIPEVAEGEFVGTMADDGSFEWGRALATHRYHYEGDLISHSGPHFRIRMTPQHRVWYWSQAGRLECRKAWRLAETTTTYRIPASAAGSTEEYPVLDDELRILAWVLTGGYYKKGKVEIYQSKPEGREEIVSILSRLGLQFSESTRDRGTNFTATMAQCVYRIVGESRKRVEALFDGDKKSLPGWVQELSERQVGVFLESLIDGDGTRVNAAYCLYGKREFLSKVQSILVANGYRASLARRHRESGGWYDCLNITRRKQVKIQSANLKKEPYAGDVFCITTVNDNFFVRHKGVVSVTGNSRIEKWCVTQALANKRDAAYLAGLFSTQSVLSLEKRGVQYFKQGVFYDNCRIPATIKRGLCYFTHGSRVGQSPAKLMLSDFGFNVVFGHCHTADMYHTRNVAMGELMAACPGTLSRQQPLWRHTSPTNWTQGFALQIVSENDEFLHINVPIIQGRSFLKPLIGNMI